MYLVDTNVISERRRGNGRIPGLPASSITTLMSCSCLFSSSVNFSPAWNTLATRGDADQANLLQAWYEGIKSEFSDRVLSFDITCAEFWGKLMGINDQHPVDEQIAAIAPVYELTVVSRNIRHFDNTGVRLLNPFLADRTPGTPAS